MGLRLAEGVDQCRDVVAQGLERIVLDPQWPARGAEATHVGRHRPVSRPRQRRDEVAVLVGELREAV
jgi:hypothetical protein